jgi:hypothetical protein
MPVFRRVLPRGPVPALHWHYFEAVDPDPERAQVWCYTDRLSCLPGETLAVHAAATVPRMSLEIRRDGTATQTVWHRDAVPVAWPDTPADCSVAGCGWPVAARLEVPWDWRSGGYLLIARVEGRDGTLVEHHHLFVVRAPAGRRARRALLAATATWLAYNDWGGSNHYEGLTGPSGDRFSPVVSLDRPWARGFVSLPAGAPRITPVAPPPPGTAPRYPHMEWAFANGYSKKYASAGWASYERPFLAWAETAGFDCDVLTQHDLEADPAALEGYRCLVIVGHDEYWSWAMRDRLDDWVEAGGRVARFAGNLFWQVRLQDGGRRQVCHKASARQTDPVFRTAERHLTTTCWDAPEVGRPAAASLGLTGTRGVYAGWGGCVPRGSGGFTVYRPEHWAFEGAGLHYGDVLGGASRAFGYEVDSVGYVVRDGLVWPTGEDGAPAGLEILGLGLATTLEEDHAGDGRGLFIGRRDAAIVAEAVTGAATPQAVERYARGAGMIAGFRRGRGEVFNAASVEWVAGLVRGDDQVARVTANVLGRFAAP